eukprot:168169-Hanusia_phi.AAC.3
MFAGADVDEAWDQMGNPLMPMEEMEKEKNRTSVLYRPGSNLLHFGPFAGDLNEAVLANEEGKVLVDSSGEEIMVSHRVREEDDGRERRGGAREEEEES